MRRRKSERMLAVGVLFIVGLLLILLSVRTHAGTHLRKPKPRDADNLTFARVVSNVRNSVGYDNLKKLKRGFVVEEGLADSNPSNGFVYMFGSNGEIRRRAMSQNPNPFIFDGKDGWLIDRVSGEPTPPIPQRLREKLLFPLWVRSGHWLDEKAPLVMSILPNESDDKRVALSMKFKDGLVDGKLFVDRATWLPTTLVVGYEAGPYTVELKDYQEAFGFRYTHQIAISYRGTTGNYKVKSITEISPADGNVFTKPALPNDTTFDNSIPAELKVGKGRHYYVRPLVDGRDLGWFNFDTGFGSMSIDAKFADELGMPVLDTMKIKGRDGNVRTVTIRRGKTFQLGRVTIKNPIYLAEDLSDKDAPPEEKRAGVCGYPLFARVVAEVTRGGERIALYDPANYRLPKGKWQELSFVEHTPAVRARLEGNREGLFILDTGNSGAVTFNSQYTKEQRLLEGRQVNQETGSGSGGAYKYLSGSLEWFELAGYKFKRPRAEFGIGGEGFEMEGRAGNIGQDFMSAFTVVFDYSHKRVAFIR